MIFLKKISFVVIAIGSFILIFGSAKLGALVWEKTDYLLLVLLIGFLLVLAGAVSSDFFDKEVSRLIESERWKNFWKNIRNLEAVICVFIILILIFVISGYPYDVLTKGWGSSEIAHFGDFIGGVLGPILTALTFFYVIKQNYNTRKWEEKIEQERAKREEGRDHFEDNKQDLEMFLQRFEFLARKFTEISNPSSSRSFGMGTLLEDLNKSFGSSTLNYKESGELTGEVLSFIKMLNSIIGEVLREIHSSSSILGNNKSYPHSKNISTKFYFLISFLSIKMIYDLNNVMEHRGANSSWDLNQNANYLISLKEHLKKYNDLPALEEKEKIEEICVASDKLFLERKNKG